MVLRKTVVTTSFGAAGIAGGVNGKHFVVADTEEEMASKILELIENKNQRENIGRNARKLVEEKYRWSSIKKILLKEIEGIV
jgi:glycosyltransferase involved in cell wall biosynthesis